MELITFNTDGMPLINGYGLLAMLMAIFSGIGKLFYDNQKLVKILAKNESLRRKRDEVSDARQEAFYHYNDVANLGIHALLCSLRTKNDLSKLEVQELAIEAAAKKHSEAEKEYYKTLKLIADEAMNNTGR